MKMKISSITIANVKGIENITIQPEHLNIYLGKNGSGKTAILSAISFGMTGIFDKQWVKTDQKSAMVKIDFEDKSSIERKKHQDGTTTVKVNGKRSSQKSLNQFLTEKLGANEDTLRALCGVDYLASLTNQELTKTLLSILPLKANRDKLLEFAHEIQKNELKRDLTKEEKRYLLSIFEEYPDILTLEHLEEAYTKEMEKRKELRAQEKILSAKSNVDDSELPKESKEELQKAFERIMKEEIRIEECKKKQLQNQKTLETIALAKQRKNALQEQLKALKEVSAPDPKLLETLENEKQKFQFSIQQVSKIMATNQANKQFFERTLDSLNKPICPLSEKLICRTDKSGLKAEVKDLIQKNTETITRQIEHIKRCEEQIKKREDSIKKYHEKQLLFVQKNSYEKQLKELIIPEEPEKLEITNNIDFQREKEEINGKLNAIAKKDIAQKFETQYQEIKAKLKNSEFAVFMLNPKKGIPSLILKICLGNLETLCNTKAKELNPSLRVRITYENSIRFLADFKGNGDYLPIEVLSTAENLMIIFLVMCIFNQVTGAKYLILDNLDKLDAVNTKKFIQLLENDQSYDHIFLAGVNHSDTVELLQKQNVMIL